MQLTHEPTLATHYRPVLDILVIRIYRDGFFFCILLDFKLSCVFKNTAFSDVKNDVDTCIRKFRFKVV